MKRLVLFFRRIYVLLLFIALEAVAINYYAGSTSYARAKILTTTNSVFGGVYKVTSAIGGYFRLRSENDALAARLQELENLVQQYRADAPETVPESFTGTGEAVEYVYKAARVIENSIARPMNYIILNRGSRDGVMDNMAVVTP